VVLAETSYRDQARVIVVLDRLVRLGMGRVAQMTARRDHAGHVDAPGRRPKLVGNRHYRARWDIAFRLRVTEFNRWLIPRAGWCKRPTCCADARD
jgi:hypothetical protein